MEVTFFVFSMKLIKKDENDRNVRPYICTGKKKIIIPTFCIMERSYKN